LQVETAQGQRELEGDAILVTIGRRPCSADLGLEACGVALDGRGHVVVDHRMQTSVAGIFAIGDLVGPPLLAHKATREGLVAAANLAGRDESYDVRAMPAAIFTDPEIATVGLSEQDARAAGFETETGMFPFAASGRALSTGESVGFVKLVSDRSSGAILGAGIVGPEASNLIAEAALAIELGATAADLAMTVHPHPTLSEALMEAADDLLGHPIHTAPKRQ
jgi:dihydrolipoamide dehydrogenase